MNLRQATKKAFNQSTNGQFAKLLAEQSRWQRKQTIASNKLSALRRQIEKFAGQLANRIDGIPEEKI